MLIQDGFLFSTKSAALLSPELRTHRIINWEDVARFMTEFRFYSGKAVNSPESLAEKAKVFLSVCPGTPHKIILCCEQSNKATPEIQAEHQEQLPMVWYRPWNSPNKFWNSFPTNNEKMRWVWGKTSVSAKRFCFSFMVLILQWALTEFLGIFKKFFKGIAHPNRNFS